MTQRLSARGLTKIPIHYVYKHVCPRTGKCLYVGHGRHERAWRCSFNESVSAYGHRSKEYSQYLMGLQLEGYLPYDWTIILHKQLTKSEACKLEQQLIKELKPEFNKPMGWKLVKLKNENLDRVKELRSQDVSYTLIGKELGVAGMTVWRALNGETKNIDSNI